MKRDWLNAVTHLITLANAQIRPDPYLGLAFNRCNYSVITTVKNKRLRKKGFFDGFMMVKLSRCVVPLSINSQGGAVHF